MQRGHFQGYCVKGDCDRLGADTSTNQPSDSVEKTPSNVVVPTASVPAHEDQQPPPISEPPADTRPAESHETIDDQSHGEQAPAQPPPPVPEDPSMSGAIPMDPSLNPADYHSTAENTTRSGVGKWLSKMISLFRYALPAAMADIDDAGVW
ncbi:unnamed protein product [Anisakis simplex]|uniref:Structural protein n=1 Tax=Anisakis simplex TaxID=6269 RepID=A0A0M3JY98_ANISI|nr:unnamed protein product [Anisakis simplex]